MTSKEQTVSKKETYILDYFNELVQSKKILDIALRFRSEKDIDVMIKVPKEKIKITEILIESDFYVKPKLRADVVNRRRDKILLLTKDKVTYEISVVDESTFDKHCNKQ